MKAILLSLCLALISQAYASGKDHFEILPGRFHKGGTMDVRILSINQAEQTMLVFFEYKIQKKPMAPIPSEYLKGDLTQELPLKYEDERGYLELEESKFEEIPNGHLGRMQDSHIINIEPKNKKSEIQITFNRSLPGLGWSKVKLLLKISVPGIKDYRLEAKRL